MKGAIFLGILAAALAWLVLAAPHVSATTTCHGTGNWCQGYGHVSTTTGGVASARCFAIRTTNTAPTCTTSGITPSNEASWTMDAGSCLTFYYFDTTSGASPPAAPNKVTLVLRADNTATQLSFVPYNAAAEPSNGATTTVCATDTGTTGGADRTGTYRLLLRVVKDNGPGGVGNYDITTDGVASVGSLISFDKAAYVGLMKVSSITRSAYPADSTFAYGSSGDEQVTVTATHTVPNVDANLENVRLRVSDSGLVTNGEEGPSQDSDGATDSNAFTIDNTYVAGSYVPSIRIVGTSGLTSMRWTWMAGSGHGACISKATIFVTDDTAYCSTTFSIDPEIKFDSDCTGGYSTADDVWKIQLGTSSGAVVSKMNKGETYYASTCMTNARDEYLTRSMTVSREDATPTTCASIGSLTPTGTLYSHTSTLSTGAVCLASNSDPGDMRYFRAANTDQNHRGLGSFSVSSLYYIDAHIQKSSTLVKDDFPTENSAEDTAYTISTAVTDTTHLWCHVKSVRKDVDIDTSGSVITWSYIDGTGTTRFTGTTDTASDGWTATHLDLLASTPLTPPNWATRCAISSGATFQGNYGTNDQSFTVTVPAAPTVFPGDPLRGSCTPTVSYAGETVACTVSASNVDGSARMGAASSVLFDLYNPSGTAVTTGGSVTEQGSTGVYSMTYSLGSSPAVGNWRLIFRTTDASPVTSHALFTVRVDPAVALANSLATVIANQATAATQVSGVQTTATEIDTDADEVLANQATAATQVSNVATQVSGVSTQVSGVQTTANEIDTDLDEVLAGQASLQTDTTAILAKWGTTNAATILTAVQDLQTKLGSPSDASTASTVFGKIALAHAHSDANDAATQAAIAADQATADSTYTLLADVHTELGAHGKSRTAFKVMEDVETAVAAVQTTANTIAANQATAATAAASNLATILTEFEEAEAAQDLLQNYTTQEILDALAGMNVTFTGNFTTDTAALGNLTTLLQEHRDASLELNAMSFDGLNFDGTFLLLLWLVALIWCMRNAKLFAALAATVGVACVLIPGPQWIGWVGVLFFVLALWLEAIAREKLPYHWFKGTANKET